MLVLTLSGLFYLWLSIAEVSSPLTVSPSRGLDTHLSCYAFSVTVFNFGENNQGCRSKIRVHGSQANFNAKSCFWMCGLFMQGPCFMPFLSDGILGVVSYSKEKRRTT